MNTKLRKIGNAYGVLIPKKLMDELQLDEGAVLTLTRSGNGLNMSPFDAEFSDQLEAFRSTESKHRNSYKELAK
jgi:putative addiction module antidote